MSNPSAGDPPAPYALGLEAGELVRYRAMAQRAAAREAELWTRAGITPGARVLDVGCGPGAVLAALARTVGTGGRVLGIDAAEDALSAATALLADSGITNASVRWGRAESTEVPIGSVDAVVLRHVLAHNGGAEQRIVDHLGGLLRPGGHLLLVDTDTTTFSITPSTPDLDELHQRYQAWHAARGNDPRIGRHLPALVRAAGLVEEDFRGWFEIDELPPGGRGPAWAARDALVRDGIATADDLSRWGAAFAETDTWTRRPRVIIGTFAVIARRPDDTPT